MLCAWDAFINLLPVSIRNDVDKLGRMALQEVRLRIGLPPELILKNRSIVLDKPVRPEDLQHCVNFASRYSPWTTGTIGHGYITAPGGHRIGVLGRYACEQGRCLSLQTPAMLCLRVARDFDGIASDAADIDGSILIIGKPGCGKTTLLRDLIRQRSNRHAGAISVVDEKEEIFPRHNNNLCFPPGRHTDVVSGCRKEEGIEMALRNMTPSIIAVDEITAAEDCAAILHAGWCGVDLYATAHAGSLGDLLNRPVYKPITQIGLFQTILIMQPDKSWHMERINL